MSIRILDTVTGRTLTLPMMPDKVRFKSGTKFIDYEIMKIGDVVVPLGEELSEISWSGILPGAKRQGNGWVGSWISPHDVESLWSIWRNQGRKLRVVVDGTPLAHGMYLQTYDMEYSGGFGDYKYSIQFVSARDLEVNIEVKETTTPEDNSGGQTEQVDTTRYVTVTGGRVNVRRKPSTSGKIVFVAKKGQKYEYAGEKSGNWYSILVNGEKLWISSKYSKLGTGSGSSSKSSSSSSGNRTYTVKKGDTLWGLAQKYYGKGSSYTKIKNANKISGTTIYVGQKLIIP